MNIDTGVTRDEFWQIYVVDRSRGLLADAADAVGSDPGIRELRLRQFALFTTSIVVEADRKTVQRGEACVGWSCVSLIPRSNSGGGTGQQQ